MTIRPVFLVLALLATTSLAAGCSKTEHKESAAVPAAAPQPAPPVAAAAEPPTTTENKQVPSEADIRAQAERESQLELRAAAAEARARLAEIELRDQTTRALLQQQQATQMEAERAAYLAGQARVLDAENAALRVRALESEQRAIEAERAAYGAVNSVIVVQPPQRGFGYPRPSLPAPNEPPPKGVGTRNVGLRPAVPNLTPPGAPATLPPPRTQSTDEPQFDTMRARKPRATRDVP